MEHDGGPSAVAGVGLVIALLIAIGSAILFFQPFAPRTRDAVGAFWFAEAISIIALPLLLVFRAGNGRLAAAGVTFVAALLPTYVGVMIAIYPGGSRDVPPSAVPMVTANLAVLLFAALHFRGDTRVFLFGVMGVVLLSVFALNLLFR